MLSDDASFVSALGASLTGAACSALAGSALATSALGASAFEAAAADPLSSTIAIACPTWTVSPSSANCSERVPV